MVVTIEHNSREIPKTLRKNQNPVLFRFRIRIRKGGVKGGVMENVNVSKAIGAGFVATLVMTMMMYMAPMMGMPKMDIAAMLGSMFTSGMPQTLSGPWWTGMIIHFINGTVIFPTIYAYWVYPMLAGGSWLRGHSGV